MRREQVHKLVLNQLITVQTDLQPMRTSVQSLLWAGCNHTEDGITLEKLAIRFKNQELAQSFYKTVQSIVEKLKNTPQQQEDEESDEPDVIEEGNDDYNSDESDETR